MSKKSSLFIPPERVRNFSIIAHIDHGKSTLADRIMQFTGCISDREMGEQMLDTMDIERERGITIKARAVRTTFAYESEKGSEDFQFNLIDTPGHVDFSYEVSRSLKACDGALLLVDATQGVEAQTMSNAYMAIEEDLELIPVMNKVDLGHAEPERVLREMEELFGFKKEEVYQISSKTGLGVPELMRGIVERIPTPQLDETDELRALLFDAEYNDFRGVISYVKVYSGSIQAKDNLVMVGTDNRCDVTEVGVFTPKMTPVEKLNPGDVGYLISNIKSLSTVRVGDTIGRLHSEVEALPGYEEPKKVVFCSLYPANNVEFESLKKAVERLHLNDSSFSYQVESSSALSFGYRCGFMGMLHMDVIRERLERENDLAVIQTAPHVTYEVLKKDGTVEQVNTPQDLPNASQIEELREPMVSASIVAPSEYIGAIMKLAEERRGRYIKTQYMSKTRVVIDYILPFNEVVFDFFDKMKSATKGYATLDYTFLAYEKSDLVNMDILVNGEPVDALGCILHRSKSEVRGRGVIKRLKKEIPRHQFQIALQASVGARVIARENVQALRKDVTAKCYGGDISRKRKLLEKQKDGKKRMKNIGNVTVPQEAFMAVLNLQESNG